MISESLRLIERQREHRLMHDDDKMSIHRNVSQQSQDSIERLTRIIKPKEAIRKSSENGFIVSVVYPDNIIRLISRTCLKSIPVANQIASVLSSKFADTSNKPITSEVIGIIQYQDKIALELNYPEFHTDLEIISSAMKQYFGHSDVWNEKAHINIATGKVDDLSNRNLLERSLPATVELTPVRIGIISDHDQL